MSTDDQIGLEQVAVAITGLRRASVGSIALMVGGIAVVTFSLLYSISRLRPLEQSVAVRQAQIRRLDSTAAQLEARNREIQNQLDRWIDTPDLPVVYLQSTPGVSDTIPLRDLRIALRRHLIAALAHRLVDEQVRVTQVRYYHVADARIADSLAMLTSQVFKLRGCDEPVTASFKRGFESRVRDGLFEIYVSPHCTSGQVVEDARPE
jgi:hypothetical protein